MSITHQKRLAIILCLAAVCLLTVSGILGYLRYAQAFESNAEVIKSYQTIRAANQALISLDEASLEVSTFLFSKNTTGIKNLPELIISAQLNMTTLHALIQDNPIEIKLYNEMRPLFNKKIAILNQTIAIYAAGNNDSALQFASDADRLQLTVSISQLLFEIKKIEIGQLDHSMALYKLKKIDADKFFIFLGSLNVLFLIFNFMFMRRFLE